MAEYCITLLNDTHDMSGINETRIVLISKVNKPISMTQFRPISLCNILYKITAKMLVNRFYKVLHYCIDKAQSAFVPRRLITDNILAAYEILHSMSKRVSGSTRSFVLKLNINKAYDRVEWSFLQMMMEQLGFSRDWIGKKRRMLYPSQRPSTVRPT